MDADIVAMISVVLWAASEIIGMSKLRSNSTIQLVLEILLKIFPKK